MEQNFSHMNFSKEEGQELREEQLKDFKEFRAGCLDSTQHSINRNMSTHSEVLAPFNSEQSEDFYHNTVEYQNFINEQLEMAAGKLFGIGIFKESEKKVEFSIRVQALEQEYRVKNNPKLDNGIYLSYDASKNEKRDLRKNRIEI